MRGGGEEGGAGAAGGEGVSGVAIQPQVLGPQQQGGGQQQQGDAQPAVDGAQVGGVKVPKTNFQSLVTPQRDACQCGLVLCCTVPHCGADVRNSRCLPATAAKLEIFQCNTQWS